MNKLVMVFVLLLSPSLLLAQEKGKVVTFMPAGQIASDAEKKQLETEKEIIRLSGYMSKLTAFLSVAQENKALCLDKN